MKEESDFYYSQKQEELIFSTIDINSIYLCYFKGKRYTEECKKGFYKNKKNNFDDSVYLGSGTYKDITINTRGI